VLNPRELLRRPIADPAVACDHDQALGTDDGKPLVIQRAASDFGQIRVARVHDVAVLLGQCLAERQVVLVDEEPGGQGSLRGQGAELLLVGDRGPDLFVRQLVILGDRVDRLACIGKFPEPFRRHT